MLVANLPITYPAMGISTTGLITTGASNVIDTAALASTHTYVVKIQPILITGTGNSIRLVVVGPGTAGATTVLSNTWIGLPATTGNTWSFKSSSPAPTRITWGGSNSVTVSQGQTAISDIISFQFNDVATSISFDIASGSVIRKRTGLNTANAASYFKAATTEAGTAVKSASYTTEGGVVYAISYIESGD